MKRLTKIITAFLLTLTVLLSVMPIQAASGSITATLSSSSITLGKTVTLTVKYKCASGVYGATSYLTYNTSCLKLSSYSAGDNFNKSNGKLLAEGDKQTTVTYTFKFTAIRTGSASIKLTTDEFYDDDIKSVSGYSSSLTKTVTIKAASTSTSTPTTTQSSDASLSSLTVTGYELGFEPNVKDYTIYTAHDVSTLQIEAKAASSKATVGKITNDVLPGWNAIQIVCTAENKKTATYTLNVYVEPLPEIWYILNGQKVGVVVNLDNVKVEEGFEPEEVTVGENTLTTFVKGQYRLLYLSDEQFNKAFYIYDKDQNVIVEKYQPLTVGSRQMAVAQFNYADYEKLLAKDTFEQGKVEIGGLTIDGWKYRDAKLADFSVVCLRDENGQAQLYRYDQKEQTLQRYVAPSEGYTSQQALLMAGSIAGIAALIMLAAVVIKNARRKAVNS